MLKVKSAIQVLKIFTFIFFLNALFFSFWASPALAQSSTPSADQATTQIANNSNVSPTSSLYTDYIVHNMFHTFSCIAVGASVLGQPCLTYQLQKDANGVFQSVPVLSLVNTSGGVLGTTTGLLGALFVNPPVRSSEYLASIGQELPIVKVANAQVVGTGSNVLSPIFTLWQVSRNISYIVMIILFVIIGLMVMFRTKINPQTVITAQAALPGLVLGLILITFSYFLAGLISDLAFIATNLVGYYFHVAQGKPAPVQDLVYVLGDKNILTIFSPFTKIVNLGAVYNTVGSVWQHLEVPDSNLLPWKLGPQQLLQSLAAMIVAQFVLPFGGLFGGVAQLVSGVGSAAITIAKPEAVVSFALSFIAMAVLIYTMFKLLLRLVNSYLTIIFLTISAPFQFLAAALPGRQSIATDWLLNMLANVLAFPAVIAVLYFVAFILGPQTVKNNCANPCPFEIVGYVQQENSFVTNVSADEETPAVPVTPSRAGIQIVSNSTFPLLGGFDLMFVKLILAFGALVALPAIPDVIARTIGRVSQAGQLIGQEIGAGTSAGQRYAGQFREAPSGFAREAGNLKDQPGYLYKSGGWQKVTSSSGHSVHEQYVAGLRPGQFTRMGAALKGWFK